MTETKIPFKPVRCKESDLSTLSPVDGYVYFTTDTQKIYCANQNKFLPMGGNSGVYYGKRTFAENETNTGETDFVFDLNKEEIEGDQVPNVNDLILNIPDGGFYRVIDVYGNLITGRRLAVSGTGSSEGGSTSQRPLITPEVLGIQYFKLGNIDDMKIAFSCSSPVDDGRNYIASIKYYFGNQDNPEQAVNYKFGELIKFDVSKYLNNFSTSNRNTLYVEVIDAYGNRSVKQSFYFYLIELTLNSDATPISKITLGDDAPYRYPCKPKGGAGLEDLFIELKLSPLNNPQQVLHTEQRSIKNVNTDYNFNINFNQITNAEGESLISHGVYLLTARFCGRVPLTQTIISSSEQYVQIAVYDESVGTPLIATNFKNGSIMQYAQFSLQYMIIDEGNVTTVNPLIYYGLNYSTETAELNTLSFWDHTFITPGVYDIAIQYEGAKTVLGTLRVTSYSGDIPVIDTDAAEFYLTALGKSNTQADRDVWESNGHAAVFENFLWGNENGWITNENNETALKITNGAKLEIPTYHPFATNAITNGLTIELDFMFSGVLDYSKPLIHCLSKYNSNNEERIQTGFNITGQKATLNSAYYKATTTAIVGEEDEDGNINKQDMALQAFTQYFNEDTRIHLTYVIDRVPDWSLVEDNFYFVYTYLNGVLSGIMRLDVDPQNKTADSFKDYVGVPSHMVFDSTYGDIYLYNIRVYRNALDMRTIINNYIADLTDIEKKVELYKDNNIFTTDGYIDIKAIQSLSYSCGIPYVLFNGGNLMKEEFEDSFAFSENYALPVTKSDYRFMSMKMYDVDEKTGETYLAIDVPIEAQNESDNENIVEKFDDFVEGTSYLPKRGVQVYGQGTSSMVYPVKNLRLKFVQKNDFPQVYKGAYPTEIVCFKADFMDSSSAHNTCTGNLVYDIYQAMSLKTPPQTFKVNNQGKEGIAKYDLVSAIKGFPIVCFYAPGDSTDYQFIGRYNFNLDKATPEPFGFVPQKVYTGETVTDANGITRKVVNVCGLKTEIVEGKTVLPIDEEGQEIERDIVQCWEILNNDNGSPTKFLKLRDTNEDGTEKYATFDACLKAQTAKGDKYNWMEYYEDRYPDAIVGGGKYLLGDKKKKQYEHYDEDLNNGLFRLANWINSTSTRDGDPTGQSLEIPAFYQTMDTAWNKNKIYYNADGSEHLIRTEQGTKIEDTSTIETTLTNMAVNKNTFINKVGNGEFGTYAFLYSDNWYLNGTLVSLAEYGVSFVGTPKEGNGLTVTYFETNDWSNALYDKFEVDNAIYRLSKFKTEFTQYFDMDFSLFYYVMTLTLLMMDSRAKNMMLASWDQNIWYPIFYDMDTMLGINNTGFNKFSFDTEDDPADKVFNGFDSVLWNNFKTCFPSRIADFYARMRSSMTLTKLLETYNENGTDAWNEAFCSADAYYKYERPYEEGYYDGKEGKQIARGTISYLYAAQGRRSNHRAWWLSNRLNYLDSKYIPTTYGNEKPSQVDTFSFRAYALPEQKSTTKAEACILQTPPNHQFKIKALNNSYQSIFIGNIVYGPVYTTAGQTITLGPEEVKHEVESYILNPQLIADLGDLSDKYIGSLYFPGVQTRLTELKFGRSSRSHSVAITTNETFEGVATVDNADFIRKIGGRVPFNNYTFSYDVDAWKLNGDNVNLSDYGIHLTKAPKDEDQITISYQDRYSNYYNNLLSALNLGSSCPYLQEVNIARCTGLKSVSFTECPRLQILDAEGSKLTNINFPANSILKEIYVPDTLESLTLTNQPYLDTIKFDTSASRLTSIVLDNVPSCNTYNLVKQVFSTENAKSFYLTNINWEITDAQIATENGRLTGIDILDILLSDKAYPSKEDYSKSQSLSGVITINIPGIKVNEYEIYEKYKQSFPNVTIRYGSNIDEIVTAYNLVFMTSNDETAVVHYEVKTSSGQDLTLKQLTSADGPTGENMRIPSRASSSSHDYIFTGYWIDQNNKYYRTSRATENKPGSIDFDTFKDYESDMTFYPEYDQVDRYYDVKFYDGEGNVILQSGTDDRGNVLIDAEVWPVKYGTPYKGPVQDFLYKDDSKLADELRYSFQGWSGTNYEDMNIINPEYINLKTYNVTGPLVLYPHFLIEDVHEKATSEDYFSVSNGIINLKNDYKDTLQGKITIPTTVKGAKVHTIGAFANGYKSQSKITHVYFLNNSEITNIDISAFAYCRELLIVDLPTTIREIGNSAFAGCEKLTTVTLNDNITTIGNSAFSGCSNLVLTALPASLKTIGGSAFQSGGPGIQITSLPLGIEVIPAWTFNGCSNVKITEFGGDSSKLKEIGTNSFNNAGNGNGKPNVEDINIYYSVEIIDVDAFKGYATNTLKNVYFARPWEDGESYGALVSEMGFDVTNPDLNFASLPDA